MKSTTVRRFCLCLLLLVPALNAFSQDTVRVMTYNLLRYGAQGISCTPTGVTARNPWLTSIMGATMPDILGINEMGPYSGPTSPANNLLINVLQPLNPAYRAATVTFNGSQDVTNAMYYNSDKVGLAVQTVIPEPTLTLRDINYYKFYYKGPGLALGDTTFLEVVQVHLHSSDENTRQVQTQDIMNYLDALGYSGNFIVQGDLNLDGSTAGSFQTMVAHTNANCKLNDVLNLTGNWHNNNNAKRAMTQATSSSPAPCGSGGALDDRFDHILVSNSLLSGTQGITALPSTYWVPGNTNAPNAAVSQTVTNSLKTNSDHFPVVLDFQISRAVTSGDAFIAQQPLQLLSNPTHGHIDVALHMDALNGTGHTLQLWSISGQRLRTWEVGADQTLRLDVEDVAAGAYLLQLSNANGPVSTVKVILTAK